MTNYYFDMARYCEQKESEHKDDENMRAFWHSAKVGFKRRWAESIKKGGM